MKHGWGLKDAWQQSRQALMGWVTILAAGHALGQMLAYADPARTPGLASPAPWRPPGTRRAGLIRAGLARLLREARPRSCPRSRENRTGEPADTPGGGHPPAPKPPEPTVRMSSRRPCRRGSSSGAGPAACKLQDFSITIINVKIKSVID